MKRSIILSVVWLAMTLSPYLTVLAQNGNETEEANPAATTQQPSAGGGDPQKQDIKDTFTEKSLSAQRGQGDQQEGNNTPDDETQAGRENTAGYVDSRTGIPSSKGGNADETISVNPVMQTNKSDSGMMGWITFFLALAALGIAAYNYYTLHPKKEKKRSSRQQEQASASESKQLQELVKQNRILTDNISRLGSRINEIEVRLERLAKQSQGTPTPQAYNGGGGSSAQQQSSNSGATTRYATTVMGEGFPDDGLTNANGNYVIAVLSIKGDAGSFAINDLAAAQSFLISNFAYGAGRVCDIQQQNSSPTRVQTIRPGSIQRQGNSWKVTSKALVSLV